MAQRTILLRLWLTLGPVLAWFARRHLRNRVDRGKEDPYRYVEKLGQPSQARPDGRLAWLHAVGVGEVLVLPSVARAMTRQDPSLHFLITSSSRTSGVAIEGALPANALHQYCPLDATPFVQAFLDHWRPDLVVWAERDIWPAMIAETAARGVPMAIINARMDNAAFARKRRLRRFFAELYAMMRFISLQDDQSLKHFRFFGVDAVRLHLTGSLKAAADPLPDQPETRGRLRTQLEGHMIWIAASTHPDEETTAAKAHAILMQSDPGAILVIAPREPSRAPQITQDLRAAGFDAALIGTDNTIKKISPILILAEIGQLGLWYRLADTAFVGGSLANIGGHNPYEPARLDCAILHGPHIQNFTADYAAFTAENAALLVHSASDIAAALIAPATKEMRAPAAKIASQSAAVLDADVTRLCQLLGRNEAAA